MAQYQVVSECAYATVTGPFGKSVQLLLKGAPFPADDPKLKVYLEDGYVAQVGGDIGGLNADGVPAGAFETDVPPGVTSTPVEKSVEQRKAEAEAAEKSRAAAELAEKRTAAKAKVDALNGAAPDGRASKDVLVEYLVGKGHDYSELTKQEPAELRQLVKQRQQS